MLAIPSSFCRSLFTGDSEHAPANKVPSRLQAGSYVSLRGLLVFLALISQLSALNFSARATELTDLGLGLSYLRVHAFDETAKGTIAAIHEREYVVLDLRQATGTPEAAALLGTSLATRELKTPVFILVGPGTPSALAAVVSAHSTHGLTLGVKDSVPTPQVVIDQSKDADQRAYAAAESGEPLTKLISGKIGKERYDESVLMKEFLNGNSSAAPPTGTDSLDVPADAPKPPATAVKEGELAAPKPPEPPVVSKVEPLIDRVLQRAVQLQRALIAIKQRS